MVKIIRIRSKSTGKVHVEHKHIKGRIACGSSNMAGFDYVDKAVTCGRCLYIYETLYSDVHINKLRRQANHLDTFGYNVAGDLNVYLSPEFLRIFADYMEENGFMTESEALKKILIEHVKERALLISLGTQ